MTKNIVAILSADNRIVWSDFKAPKQLMKLAGKPVIEHTLDALLQKKLMR